MAGTRHIQHKVNFPLNEYPKDILLTTAVIIAHSSCAFQIIAYKMARRQPLGGSSTTQKPARRNVFAVIRHEFYWKCLVSTILVQLCILYAAWCHFSYYVFAEMSITTSSHGPCAQGYNFIPIAFGVLLYIVYFMECWHNRVKEAKIKKASHAEALEIIQNLRAAVPIVWWNSVSYHYVRRTRQITRYRNGDAITATQAFYERVNSHNAGSVFMFDACGVKDISKNLTDLEAYPVTKIHLSKGFVFTCVEAANEFEEQRARFFNENEVRDDYMEVREGLEFADVPFTENLIVFSTQNRTRPWYLYSTTFWLFSIALLSWPLRMWCELRTAHVNYQITKLFGTNYLSPSSNNYTGPITRASTMDSRELELAAQRDSFLVVPSYSEAMLVEPQYPLNQLFCQYAVYRSNDRTMTTSNDNTVLTTYGAIRNNLSSDNYRFQQTVRPNRMQFLSRAPIRSRSMNLCLPRHRRDEPFVICTQSTPIPRPNRRAPPRSASISGLSTSWRSPFYESIGSRSSEDRRPLIKQVRHIDEPPPPYEVALRMCAPLYERLRRSASSITSRLNSLSHSSSKDLPHRRQINIDEPGSSRVTA
ncbi:hypothetical protein AB6A40_002218 [Gnathostoma spinigerum]|uniref:Transmembrane protein 151B n=1 Tax=Gnathostoma spinigerum TaxID=75299 RepID=A0ABD6E613_9BILA